MIDLSMTVTITLLELFIIIASSIFSVAIMLYLITLIKGKRKYYVCKFAYIPKDVWGKVKENASLRKMNIPTYLGSSVYHYNSKVSFGDRKFNIYNHNFSDYSKIK